MKTTDLRRTLVERFSPRRHGGSENSGGGDVRPPGPGFFPGTDAMARRCRLAMLGSIVLAFMSVASICGAAEERSPRPMDSRNIKTGSRIPDQGYCDQPYDVVTNDGDWLCTLTTGSGPEGQGGQQVVATITQGKALR